MTNTTTDIPTPAFVVPSGFHLVKDPPVPPAPAPAPTPTPVVPAPTAPFGTTVIFSALLALGHSRKFLIAAFAVIQTLVFVVNPQFNQDTWKAIDGLAAVLIGSIAAEDAATKSAGGSSLKT